MTETPTIKTPKVFVLSVAMVQKAINDPQFFALMPEFNSMRGIINAAKVQAQTPKRGGCGGCRANKTVINILRSFMDVVEVLSADGKIRLRRYFGNIPVLIQQKNPQNNRFETKTL